MNTLLNGRSESEPGLCQLLDTTKKLADLDVSKTDDPELTAAIAQLVPATSPSNSQRYQTLASQIETIKRLGEDERMRPAYSLLTKELPDDTQLFRFLRAAWAANRKYSADRDDLKRAKALANHIRETSKVLSEQLIEFQKIEMDDNPPEFFDIRHLLSKSESEHSSAYHFERWQFLKGHVIGECHPVSPEVCPNDESLEPYPFTYLYEEYEKQLTAEAEAITKTYGDTQADLHLAWRSSPQLPALLDIVSEAAAEYAPQKAGFVGAATSSRKANIKTEYLRALADILTEDPVIPLSKDIMKAMVSVANVVINDPEIDTSYDDVRKALS